LLSTFKSPWINKDAIIARANLKDLYNLYRQSKIQEHRYIYKAHKKEYNVILKTAKANYIQNIITSSNNTSKVLWEFVNKERGSPNNTRTSNIFNKTFIEMVCKPMPDNKPPHTSNNITNLKDSFILLEITETELIKIIQSMKKKKSAGLDEISTYLLKKKYTSHNKVAVNLVNVSIREGIFPSKLKKSVVKPIYKKGGKKKKMQLIIGQLLLYPLFQRF
jgi:hypothetical protein